MPFYEYQCTACEHRLEALQKMSDDPLVYCPECGEASLKKLISAAAFHLKGTGWYETDFKNNDKKADKNGSDKPSENKSDSKGDSTTKTADATSSVKSDKKADSAKPTSTAA